MDTPVTNGFAYFVSNSQKCRKGPFKVDMFSERKTGRKSLKLSTFKKGRKINLVYHSPLECTGSTHKHLYNTIHLNKVLDTS